MRIKINAKIHQIFREFGFYEQLKKECDWYACQILIYVSDKYEKPEIYFDQINDEDCFKAADEFFKMPEEMCQPWVEAATNAVPYVLECEDTSLNIRGFCKIQGYEEVQRACAEGRHDFSPIKEGFLGITVIYEDGRKDEIEEYNFD